MEVRNRIVLPPMTLGYGEPDANVTQRHRDYYEARAKGGVGLIITEAASINPERKYGLFPLGLYDDSQIASWSEMAKVVHSHGAKVAVQLMDPGPESIQLLTGKQPVGPSPVVGHSPFRSVPRELTVGEIEGDRGVRDPENLLKNLADHALVHVAAAHQAGELVGRHEFAEASA